jgi:hypothetical protein
VRLVQGRDSRHGPGPRPRHDGIRFTAQVATASRTTDPGFMPVEKGRTAGFKGTAAGVLGKRPVIECRFAGKLGDDMTPDWPVTRGYAVEITGDPDVRLTIESPGHFDGAVTTAMPCANAIPTACAAPSAILNQDELSLVRGSLPSTENQALMSPNE